MFDKLIFHVDVNSAYLSWEAVYRLEHLGAAQDLRTIPSAVGGDAAMRRGITNRRNHSRSPGEMPGSGTGSS